MSERVTVAFRWPIVRARMEALGQWFRPAWAADDGSLRVGHSGDMVTMIEDLGKKAHL